MLLQENIRIGNVMRAHYPIMITVGKITEREANRRLDHNKKLVSLLQQAVNSRKPTTKLSSLFNQL